MTDAAPELRRSLKSLLPRPLGRTNQRSNREGRSIVDPERSHMTRLGGRMNRFPPFGKATTDTSADQAGILFREVVRCPGLGTATTLTLTRAPDRLRGGRLFDDARQLPDQGDCEFSEEI